MKDSDWAIVGPFVVFLLLLFLFVSVLTSPVGMPVFNGGSAADVEYECRLSSPGFHVIVYDCEPVGGESEENQGR